MKSKLFDPEKSLISLGIFKAVIFIHVAAAFILSLAILYNSNLSPNFSYAGVNFFVEVFRVPLAILALIIPMVALLASNHRSEQTIAQIKSSTSQNTFSNHYKHLEEFEKYCESLFTEKDKVTRPRHLHRKIYSNSQLGSYEVDQSFIEETEQHINNCLKLIKRLNTNKLEEWVPALNELTNIIKRFGARNYILITSDPSSSVVTFKDISVHIPDGDVRNIIIMFFMQIRILKNAVEFTPSAPFESLTNKISEVNLARIPSIPARSPKSFPGLNIEPLLNDYGLLLPE